MKLHTLKPGEGSTKEATRVGRGQGSGKGGTSARGHKGAKSRSGYSQKAGFEGGQMPLHRRLPKFGFKNPFRVSYTIINLDRLDEIAAEAKVSELTPAFLAEHKYIAKKDQPLKVLANGEIKAKLKVSAHKFSAAAKAAIEQAGGEAIIIEA
ncbi:MAG: 50S ribosomal protein L15 [Bacteroidetes bacterium]|jgi:large subunit ribosomal protein L15|nr:50S ribosomal protein L15 [Bacteroidota bacterium]